MPFTKGADPDALDRSAQRLQDVATQLHEVQSAALAAVGALAGNWQGGDFTSASSQFRTQAGPSLAKAAETLQGLATRLRQNAQAQRVASGDTGGPGGPGGPVAGPGGRGGSGGGDGAPGAGGDGEPSQRAKAGYTSDGHRREVTRTFGDHEVTVGHNALGPVHSYDLEHKTTSGHVTRGEKYGETYVGDHRLGQEHGRSYSSERPLGYQGTHAAPPHEPAHAAPPSPNRLSQHVGATYEVAGPQGDVAALRLSGSGLDGHARGDLALLQARYETKAEAGFKNGMLMAGGSATAGAYLARASGQLTAGPAYVKGETYVGAEANAHAGVGIGKDGLQAHVGGDAFVGGKVDATAGFQTSDVTASGGVGVSYGLGVHGSADASLSMDKVGVNVDVGATLGLGVDIKFDVSISPKHVLDDVGHALDPTNWF